MFHFEESSVKWMHIHTSLCERKWMASHVTGSVLGVDGCSTVGTWGDSYECTSHHGAFDFCYIHVICTHC